MNKGKRNFKGMLMGFTETMNVQNCVTFVYSIEFAWLTTHVNLFHLGGRRKKNRTSDLPGNGNGGED